MSNVVVTGGADGIGLAIAQCFQAQIARVYVCDIREDAIEKALAENPGLCGGRADVGNADEVAVFFGQVFDEFGTVDVLVNNVGIEGPHCAVEDIEPAQWRQMMDVNLSGMFVCARQVIPQMKERNSGVIINISTGSVKTKPTRRAGYVVSKAAVEEFTRVLAKELGPWGIRCNAIQPGLMNNPRMQGIIARYAKERGVSEQEVLQGYLDYISMRTPIEMSEIGEVCVFLASNSAKHITAQIISVDGNIEWEK